MQTQGKGMLAQPGSDNYAACSPLEQSVGLPGEEAEIRADQAPVLPKTQDSPVIVAAEGKIGAPGKIRVHVLRIVGQQDGKAVRVKDLRKLC